MSKIIVYAPETQASLLQKKRVAAYCRVSTNSEDQNHSFAAQNLYFKRAFQNSTEYELIGIYADIGISGTKSNRPEFMRMLDDCRCGKVDRIVCKSISRFARNTRDCLNALRELKKLGITVKFDKEGIDTARVTDEIMITIMEGLAQEESSSISRNIRWSLKRRMATGTLGVARVPYGYVKNERGVLVIDKEKAQVVRHIFDMYLSGMGARKIAIALNSKHIPSPTGREWNNITILKILKQEKYLGDILWQKTYSVFMGVHDQINRRDVKSYYLRDVHPSIIDRETFIKVQELRQKSSKITKRIEFDNPFKGKIRCTCGRSCVLIKGKRPYWECTGRWDISNPCNNHKFYHDELLIIWQKFCFKLRNCADEIFTPMLVQIQLMEEAVQGGEVAELLVQAEDIRRRRYVLHKLCTEGCISREKLMKSECELETELAQITNRVNTLNDSCDDTAEQIEMIYRAVILHPANALIDLVLENAIVNNGEITFKLISGLNFKEVL